MNKKLLKSFICLFLFSLTISGCNKKEEPVYLELDKTTLTFEAEGGSQIVNIATNAVVMINTEADWLTISGELAVITVTASENETFEVREATVEFRAETQVVTVGVTQKAKYAGVVIDGVRWATRNVDAPGTFAENPESPGMFFQWNKGTTDFLLSVDYSNSIYANSTYWLSENDPCPQGWRVPTHDELTALASSGNSWTTVNGVAGREFGQTPNTIFLPAAGYRSGASGEFQLAGDFGIYWSSTFFVPGAFCLTFSDTFLNVGNTSSVFVRSAGLSVRCVAE